MTPAPEQDARRGIDRALKDAGWLIQDRKEMNLHAGAGVAIREFPLASANGFADYLLYVDGKAAGVVERLEAAIDANLARAKRLRQAILKRAFDGRLVPQGPKDEPAGVLLERLRKEREQPRPVRPLKGSGSHGASDTATIDP